MNPHSLWSDTFFFLNQSARIFFIRAFSGCYAILTSPKEGETAVHGYNPALFLSSFGVVLMSCRVNFSRSTISIAVFCLQNLICYFLRAKVSSKWRVSRSSGTQKTCPFPWIAGYPFNRGNRYNDYANIFLQPHLGILFSLNGAVSLE